MTAENRVDELIAQFDLAQGELVKGNPEPIKKWYSNRQDVTLGNPLGPVVRGWEQVAAVLDHAASQIRDGEMGDAETFTRYVTPELAYVVRVEQSTAKAMEPTPRLRPAPSSHPDLGVRRLNCWHQERCSFTLLFVLLACSRRYGDIEHPASPQDGLIRAPFETGSQTDAAPAPDARLALDQLVGLLHTVSPTVARSVRGTRR